MRLSHVDEAGRARMVDVGEKPVTVRTAVAEGAIRMSPEAYRLVAERGGAEGDALAGSAGGGPPAGERAAGRDPPGHPLGPGPCGGTAPRHRALARAGAPA